jgi:tetratricopeptide (TPR) repeat protein
MWRVPLLRHMIAFAGTILGLTLRRHPQPKRLTLALVLWLMAGLAPGQSLDEYRKQVARLIQDYRWSEAHRVASQALEKHPQDPQLLVAAAALMLRQGRREEGERLLQSAASSPVSDPNLLTVMAELKARCGQNGEALQILREALRRAPEHPVVHYRLARLLFAEGEEVRALTHAARAVELDPSRSDYREFYALLLEGEDQLEAAYQQLRLARHRSPFSGRILLRLGERERAVGRDAQALEYFEMASAVDPENPLYYRKLAETCDNLGLGTEAAKANQKAERLERAFESYVQAVGRSVQGDYLEGVENLGRAVDENPEFLTGALFLADLYRKLGRAEEALSLYLTVLRRDPSSEAARNESAWIFMQRGDLDTALELLRSSLEGNLNEFLLEGYKKLVENDWAGAVAEFRKVESLYPLHSEVLQQISLCLK